MEGGGGVSEEWMGYVGVCGVVGVWVWWGGGGGGVGVGGGGGSN